MSKHADFLREQGWVEVEEDASQGMSPDHLDQISSQEGCPDSSRVEGPTLADMAKKTGSDVSLVLNAADAFSKARQKVRGTNPSNQSRDANPGVESGVEIVKVKPAAASNRRDSDVGGPGVKTIVVDKDRGILGMQG